MVALGQMIVLLMVLGKMTVLPIDHQLMTVLLNQDQKKLKIVLITTCQMIKLFVIPLPHGKIILIMIKKDIPKINSLLVKSRNLNDKFYKRTISQLEKRHYITIFSKL